MTKPLHVVIEVDDLNGNRVPVGLDLPGQPVPVSHFDRRQAISLRVLRVEGPAGGEVERIAGDVIEAVSRILDQEAETHVHAAAASIEETHLSEKAWREGLVMAAAHLLHAIHRIDGRGPVEVRKDDLRSLLDRAATFAGTSDEGPEIARLRDALEGSR